MKEYYNFSKMTDKELKKTRLKFSLRAAFNACVSSVVCGTSVWVAHYVYQNFSEVSNPYFVLMPQMGASLKTALVGGYVLKRAFDRYQVARIAHQEIKIRRDKDKLKPAVSAGVLKSTMLENIDQHLIPRRR